MESTPPARAREKLLPNGSAEKDLMVAQEMLKRGLHVVFVDKIEECLKATKRFWNPEEKCWEIDPDFNCIVKTLALGMPYLFGRPPQRSEIMQLNASLDLGKGGAVNLDTINDPAIRAKVAGMLKGGQAEGGKDSLNRGG